MATLEAAELLAKRTLMAERQVMRRLAKSATSDKPQLPAQFIRENLHHRMKQASVARREDWEKGPLAPRRDAMRTSIPQYKKTLVTDFERQAVSGNMPMIYGAIEREAALLDTMLTEQQLEERWAWAGGSKFPNLAVGDRVVVIEGPFKGQISTISQIEHDRGVLFMDQVGNVNVRIPTFIEKLARGQPVITMPSAMPVSAVRLVHPIPDPKTGEIKDVIIKNLVAGGFYHDRPSRKSTWYRMVPGLNMKIPWPKTARPAHEDQPVDTLRVDVESKTWVPTLTVPPMPESVIDELRGKYSKFRTRHTEEYLAKKQAEIDAKKARNKMGESMLTPLQEYNKKQREIRAAQPAPELTDEMLVKIGEIMARNRAYPLSKEAVTPEPEATGITIQELSQAVQDIPIKE
ncbi:hypothetical protein MGG_07175 [Pyricularia oryzae 70-15]|uniref:KOW domain-containing protein n=4 Tax=Pyricularia TaxID=48558 RepID=A0ABQ8N9I2_PYRGI|nr:uncharacterized protein MGG_07175 [Pyricularia oryzae 70-15]ELQ37120.1 hypothetical protein OOU_Y34scaffold00618g10 [Pyricularia oryzae Y34]KAI6266696.1 hypothetical protein MCOR26_010059 [Pyricularia oryzae]KAI6293496.1 hypothetical protein MCOR33_009108 [Pyricularia grisea]EHA55570.1 hypothetical protein MGG_07175 [Pyricularia oryzae 70-15]KAI6314791.1 hypothetical protein MCOR29_007255 [Pyricularia oryzae]